MSSISQTLAPRARRPIGFGLRFGLSMAAVAVVFTLSLGNVLTPILNMAAQAQLHAPNIALLTALPPVIKVHLATALAAIALGAVLMSVRKGRTFHRVAGWVWVSLVMLTAGATLFIRELNHGSWSYLHLFTGWVLLIAPLAVIWAKRHNVVRHRRTMMGLFYGGFAINLFIALIPGRTLWMTFFG